ncbi:MAG: hypothetical protein U5Q44_11505 [Dehalococcoidia bacterium]|nr:hypothetical protein [Dehalococcoidia bacterium]
MPFVERPDGARIRYETYGSGYPVLCFAPGGVNSEVDFWERSAINPIRDFSGEFHVIAMDQRNVGQSTGNLEPFSWGRRRGPRPARGARRHGHPAGARHGRLYRRRLLPAHHPGSA